MRAELLLEARARDAGLAGIVQQLVEQLGVDARHLRAIATAATGSRPGGTGAGRQQRPVRDLAVACRR